MMAGGWAGGGWVVVGGGWGGGRSAHRSFMLLRKLVVFESLGPACLADVAARLRAVHAPAGEHVVRAGEPGAGIYFVNAGAVRVLVDGVEVPPLPFPPAPVGLLPATGAATRRTNIGRSSVSSGPSESRHSAPIKAGPGLFGRCEFV
jgi:hypothetical protein